MFKVRVVEFRINFKLASVVNITFMARSVVFKSRLHFSIAFLVKPSGMSIHFTVFMVVGVV